MTDTKAAVRFLKYNMVYGGLPGDPSRVIITGMSGGGGLTAAVAASGDSSDYFDSLAEIGALGLTRVGNHYKNDNAVGDNVFATFSSAPIIDLNKASEANEWLYNPTRERVAAGEFADATGITNGRNAPDHQDEWQNLASAVLSQHGYQDYIRSMGLTVDGVKRTLLDMVQTALEKTLNENKSYRPELVDVSAVTTPAQAKAALDVFLRWAQANPTPGFAGLPLDWFQVTGTPGHFTVTIDDSAWDAFNEYTYWTAQWMKSAPIDGGGMDTGLGKAGRFAVGESYLWGTESDPFNHVNMVSWAMDPANWHLFGLTPSTLPDDAARQAANRELAVTLFITTPVNSTLPSIEGSPVAGQTVTADPGQWSVGDTAFAYQWVRDGRAIPGASGAQYKVKPSDAGATLTVRVTATNEAGSAQASSDPVVARR